MIGEFQDWGPHEHLTASLIDVEQQWHWMLLGSKKVPRPEPIERPGDRARAHRTDLTRSEIAARLRAQLRRGVRRE